MRAFVVLTACTLSAAASHHRFELLWRRAQRGSRGAAGTAVDVVDGIPDNASGSFPAEPDAALRDEDQACAARLECSGWRPDTSAIRAWCTVSCKRGGLVSHAQSALHDIARAVKDDSA